MALLRVRRRGSADLRLTSKVSGTLPRPKDRGGKTPANRAAETDQEEMLKLFTRLGEPPKATADNGANDD